MKIPQTKRYSIYRSLVLKDKRAKKLKFIQDGRIYYVYRVVDLESNEHYYGSRIKQKETIEEDFWFYCTSSKRKNIIKENVDNYKVKILKTFNNQDDMLIYEAFLHQYFNVRDNSSFWNSSNQTPFGYYPSSKSYKVAAEKHKKVKASKEWKETIGKEAIKKSIRGFLKTVNNPEWKETIGKEAILKAQVTKANLEWKEKHNGKYHYKTSTIEIYNNKKELVMISEGNFTNFCKINKLPRNALWNSIKEKGKPIYNSNIGKIRAKTYDYERFIGWYAVLTSSINNYKQELI